MNSDPSGCFSITNAIKSSAVSFWNGFTDHFKGYYYLVSSMFSDPLGTYFNYIKNPWNWFPAAKLMKMQVTDVVNIWKAVFSKDYNKLGYMFGERCAIALEMLIIGMTIKAIGKVVASINSGAALKFTKHGADQAFGRDGGRGVSDSAIRNTIKSPTKVTPQPKNGTLKLEGSQAVVVLNQNGEIVTAWAKSSKYYRK